MKFDVILFDFDGVICDSVGHSNAVLAEGLTEKGFPTSTDDAIRAFAGRRWADVLKMIETQIGEEVDPQFIGQQYKQLSRRVVLAAQPIPGVESFLDMTAGFRRAVVASSEIFWVTRTLDRFGLAEHFGEHVYSAALLDRGKPDPQVYQLAIDKLQVDPKRCVAIEGTTVGVTAAVAAGIPTIGLTAASHIRADDGERMRAAGASYVAHDFDDVADWIDL